MSLLPPRQPKPELPSESHLHIEPEGAPKEDALSREDKLFALVEKLTAQAGAAGLSAEQLETILTRSGLTAAEGMRASLRPENRTHRHESAFFTPQDKQRYGSWEAKPTLSRKSYFVGVEEKDERLMPAEIEAFNAITERRTARNGRWKADIKKDGPDESLWISVPCETSDQRMELPSLLLILLELNGGPSTVNVHALLRQIEALKGMVVSGVQKTATALETELLSVTG